MQNNTVIVGAFTTIHKWYLDILNKYPEAKILILDDLLIKDLVTLESDIRKIPTDIAIKMLQKLDRNVEVLRQEDIRNLNDIHVVIIWEIITEKLIEKYFQNHTKIIYESGFLYHDKSNVFTAMTKKIESEVSNYWEEDVEFMKLAYKKTLDSGCWWRQVGSVIVKDWKELFSWCNTMLPNNDECYRIWCIRDHIKPWEKTELCSAIHSEAYLISQAAREWISLKWTSLYVTHYPCTLCAKYIANSWISKVFYNQWWSNFDWERVMLSSGIELVKINL